MIDLATVTRATFDPHLGAGYTLPAPSRTIPLELTEVRSLPTRPGARPASATSPRTPPARSPGLRSITSIAMFVRRNP